MKTRCTCGSLMMCRHNEMLLGDRKPNPTYAEAVARTRSPEAYQVKVFECLACGEHTPVTYPLR